VLHPRSLGRLGLHGCDSEIRQFQLQMVPVAAHTPPYALWGWHGCSLGFRGQTDSYPLHAANLKGRYVGGTHLCFGSQWMLTTLAVVGRRGGQKAGRF